MENQIKTLQQQLKQQEKLASLGLLSAGIAHEIQNPLNFVINFSKMSEKLLKDLTEIIDDNADRLPDDEREEVADIVSDLHENIATIQKHGERAVSIIRGILLISRGKEAERLPTDICQLVKEYVWLSYHAMRANQKGFNVTIREDYDATLPPVMVIPQDLSRAVINIMNNACYAVWHKAQTAGTDYRPEIGISVARADGRIVIIITDNGEGMTDDVKRHIYDNFYTTKPAGLGTGLGMSIVHDIIENKHAGQLTFDSTEGVGTSFTIAIPLVTK